MDSQQEKDWLVFCFNASCALFSSLVLFFTSVLTNPGEYNCASHLANLVLQTKIKTVSLFIYYLYVLRKKGDKVNHIISLNCGMVLVCNPQVFFLFISPVQPSWSGSLSPSSLRIFLSILATLRGREKLSPALQRATESSVLTSLSPKL